jgi:uncharacterized protein
VFDWSQYKGNLTWLKDRTIYLTVSGSHSYGTNIPSSDLDLRGIAVATKECYLGNLNKFEQADQSEPDLTIFDLKKYIRLATDANPNALELIFTDPSDHLIITKAGQRLLDNRELFLSQKVKHTYSGYAISQLKRINCHYRYIKNPPTHQPTRSEFGLPERTVIPHDQLEAANAAIRKRIDEWNWKELDDLDPASSQLIRNEFSDKLLEITGWAWDEVDVKTWRSAANSLGISGNFIQLLDSERKYTVKLNEWRSYQDWKKNRNPTRAALEEKFGYDAKHAMHLVRLLLTCREVLETGKLIVKRPDAEFLLSIRNGAWSYDQLVAWAELQDKELTGLMTSSKLPKAPDRKKIDKLCVEMVEEML